MGHNSLLPSSPPPAWQTEQTVNPTILLSLHGIIAAGRLLYLFLWPDDAQALPAPVPMVNYTIPLSLHGIILLPEEWRLNAMYMKKNMTLLRWPIEKGLDMLGGK